MSAVLPNTSHDDEIASALQASINHAAAESDGTFAVLPPESGSSAPAAVPVPAPATPQAGSGARAGPAEVAKLRSAAKIAALAYGAWWVYSVLVRAWWFVFDLAFVFVPLGWHGVKTRSARFVLWFARFLAVDVAMQLMFLFTYGYEMTGLCMLMCLVTTASQCVAAYYVWRYSQVL